MTLKHAIMSVAGMSPKVTLLIALPVISVVKKVSGVTKSCGLGPIKIVTYIFRQCSYNHCDLRKEK